MRRQPDLAMVADHVRPVKERPLSSAEMRGRYSLRAPCIPAQSSGGTSCRTRCSSRKPRSTLMGNSPRGDAPRCVSRLISCRREKARPQRWVMRGGPLLGRKPPAHLSDRALHSPDLTGFDTWVAQRRKKLYNVATIGSRAPGLTREDQSSRAERVTLVRRRSDKAQSRLAPESLTAPGKPGVD